MGCLAHPSDQTVAGHAVRVQNTGVTFFSHASAARRSRQALHAALLAAAISAPSLGDTATRFVERLRQEGHGDLVLDYLDRAAESPLVSEAFKRSIPYQRLATLYGEANEVRDAVARSQALGALAPEIRGLAKSNADAARLLTDVLDRIATAAADVGRRSAVEATRMPDGEEQKRSLKIARRKLDSARERLATAEERIAAERGELKGVIPESKEGRRREDLGARLALVRLLRARLLHEMAETHPQGSASWKRLNTDAAKQLGELYTKYSTWGVGLYAHLYEGRCYRLLGENQLAVAALEDLTAQPAPTPELRRIVTLAQAERAALLLGTNKADEALEKPVAWLEDLTPGERDGAEAATLRYHVARASLKVAESETGAKQRKLRRQAREWLGESARVSSEVQADARDQWAAVTASMGLEAKPPENFEEAFQAGAEAIQAMLALDLAIEQASAAGEADRLSAQRRETRSAAYQALSAAVQLADKRTPAQDAARARYQLAWLDWEAGEIAKAAERAEYVARRDAETPSGEEAARLALAALERLQRDDPQGGSGALRDFVTFVNEQWPSSQVAASASAVLVSEALRSGDLASAQRVLQAVPEDQRPALALRLAVARWEKAKADASQRGESLKGLQEAFDAADADARAKAIGVTAALYLAEAALDRGDPRRAATLLNDPDYGPATRVGTEEAPADNPVFALAALKAQTRALALVDSDVGATLDRFEQTLADAPAAKTGGQRAWLGLAVALLSDTEKKPAAASALAQTLERLGAVEAAGDWNTRLWIAQARLRCGELLGDADAAQSSVTAGREAFAGLIAQAERQLGFAPSKTSILAARLRLAQCERQLGEYDAATETLTQMLSNGPALLEVQQTAAQTLQDWGVATDSVERLEEAIAGAKPASDGKNVLWGWSKIAAIAGRYAGTDPKRRDLFFLAWRNVAASRYQAALLDAGAGRQEQLRKAASTIRAVQRQNPELGGADSRQAFDALLREIQSAAGDRVTGLAKGNA